VNRYANQADLTLVQRAPGGGSDMRVSSMCGHKAQGGHYRQVGASKLALRCMACQKQREGKG
jgi:hypothetical protein